MKNGKIIIPADLNVWPHEFATAKAPLISNIRDIIFINRKRECIDIYHKK